MGGGFSYNSGQMDVYNNTININGSQRGIRSKPQEESGASASLSIAQRTAGSESRRSYEQSVDGLCTDLLMSAIGFSVGSLASYVFMNYTVYRNPFGLDPIMRTSAAIVVGMLGFVAIYVPRRTARMLRSFADELRRAQNVGEDDIDDDFYYYYTRHSTPYLALEDKVRE